MANDTRVRPHGRSRAWLVLTAKLAMVAVLTWLAVRGIAWEAVAAALSRIPVASLVLALALQGLAILVAAVRWRVCLAVCGLHMPLGRTVEIFLVSSFLGTALPAGIGQDVIRVYSAAKDGDSAGGRLARSTMSVVVDRIAGLAGFGLLSLPALATTLRGGTAATGSCAAALDGLPAISGSILVPSLLGSMLIAALAAIRWWAVLLGALTTALDLAARHWIRLMAIAGLSLLIVMLTTLLVYAIGRDLVPDAPLRDYLIFVPLIALLAQLPVSVLGLGVREAGFVFLFACDSADRADVLALSLTYFGVGLVAGLAGGAALLRRRSRDV